VAARARANSWRGSHAARALRPSPKPARRASNCPPHRGRWACRPALQPVLHVPDLVGNLAHGAITIISVRGSATMACHPG
jgi:hypothetical protein